MLLLPTDIITDIEIKHAGLLTSYLTESDFRPAISVREQQMLLDRVKEEIPREYFYFSINLIENRIIHCNGVSRWLGYADNSFSTRNYMRIVHPAHASRQQYYSLALLELLHQQQIIPKFSQPLYTCLLALKLKTGNNIYCKQECIPLQLSEEKRITDCLYLFNIIKDFNNEIFNARLVPCNEHDVKLNEKWAALIRKKFADHTDFSVQELRILKRYAHQKNSTSESIAASFKIKKSTVNTFNKRIIKKAEICSHQRFATAKEAAVYFKDVGLI